VTESQHLVDVVNQIDYVEDFRGNEKMGQPMASVSWITDVGTFSGFVMVGFRERTFPGQNGRFRSTLPVDTSQTSYEDSAKQWRPDAALRWSHSIDVLDLGVSYFNGTSREPQLTPGTNAVGAPVLLPRYALMNHFGLDTQATIESMMLKFEGVVRSDGNFGNSYGALTTGFEYTFFDVFGSGADIGVLSEYSHDTRGALATGLHKDVFSGLRLGVNDLSNSSVLLGVLTDLDSTNNAFILEGSRLITDNWKFSLKGGVFSNATQATHPLSSFRQDDYLSIELVRYFNPG